jgi:hypothetical protein
MHHSANARTAISARRAPSLQLPGTLSQKSARRAKSFRLKTHSFFEKASLPTETRRVR